MPKRTHLDLPECPHHPGVKLVCPVYAGAKGGRTTTKRYSEEQRQQWAKLGGRPPAGKKKS